MVDDAQHANVIERVEVVFGDPPFPRRLVVIEFFVRQSDLCDHPPEVRVWIVKDFTRSTTWRSYSPNPVKF